MYIQELCEEECDECVEACTNNCLEKESDKIRLLNPDKCEWCESCSMVCDNNALNLEFINDGLDRTTFEVVE